MFLSICVVFEWIWILAALQLVHSMLGPRRQRKAQSTLSINGRVTYKHKQLIRHIYSLHDKHSQMEGVQTFGQQTISATVRLR